MVLIIDMFDCSSKRNSNSSNVKTNVNTKIIGAGYDEVKMTPDEKIKKKNSTTLPNKALEKLKSSSMSDQKTIDNPEADKKLLKFWLLI